jgi:alkylhydroperoxidase family enzyme
MVPRIRWVEESAATGPAAEVYGEYMEATGRDFVPQILKCFSQRPDFLRQVMAFSNTVQFSDGHLNRAQKEMIATFVSGLNRCPY